MPMSVVGLGDAILYKLVLICCLADYFLKHILVSVAKYLAMFIISPFSSAGQQH